MANYIAEPHPDNPEVAFVVREPRTGQQYGETVGTCAGPAALDNAWAVTAILQGNRGRQPRPELCERMGYTPSADYTEP